MERTLILRSSERLARSARSPASLSNSRQSPTARHVPARAERVRCVRRPSRLELVMPALCPWSTMEHGIRLAIGECFDDISTQRPTRATSHCQFGSGARVGYYLSGGRWLSRVGTPGGAGRRARTGRGCAGRLFMIVQAILHPLRKQQITLAQSRALPRAVAAVAHTPDATYTSGSSCDMAKLACRTAM